VGRAVTSDLTVFDPTVSRKHAELVAGSDGVTVTDLGSSNGTFVNGARIYEPQFAREGDVVTFGKVPFHVSLIPASPPPPSQDDFPATLPDATIVRKLPVSGPSPLDSDLAAASGARQSETPDSAEVRQATRLELLLEIFKELARQHDVGLLLEKIVDITFKVMDVDRVSILMVDGESNEVVPRLSRSRLGETGGSRIVPRSITRRCIDERVAILTDNAAADERFTGKSILIQSVRSAMSTPLLDSEGRVLGILYVDNLTATNSFHDEDLEFLIAFSGVAALAIENSQLTDRLAHEAVVLSNFQRYFGPNLVDEIAGQASAVGIGGIKQPAVIFFSDIRGFTPMSSEMSPDDLASLLCDYFTDMVDIVFEYGGTLDKFMGDAIMAVWGAPLQRADDADRAMNAAVEMMAALKELNTQWSAMGRPPIEVGIGINYGEVFAGNIGSNRRLEYTVIGDPVNVAHRLCSQASPGQILVTEPFYAKLKNPPDAEKLDLRVRGKKDEVPTYRVKL